MKKITLKGHARPRLWHDRYKLATDMNREYLKEIPR
jgi:hypothetical protein